MDSLTSFFGRNGFLPHGYCFTWTPGLLWTMVVSDLVIAAAYLSIPVAILSFVRRRGEPSNNKVAWLFSAFILACGITHLMAVWTVWQPDYGWQAVSKAVTAVISLITAVALWPLIPKALKAPSVARLQSVITSLEAEVQRRRRAEDNLGEIQQNLAVTLASIGAGFIATDRDGRVTRMNGVAEHLTGWSQAQAEGQSFWQVFEREDRPRAYLTQSPVDVVIEQGFTIDTVQRTFAIARDGRRTEVEAQTALTRQDDGTVRGVAVVLRDMTRQRQDAAALRDSEERSRLVIESAEMGTYDWDLKSDRIIWSRRHEVLWGYGEGEFDGSYFSFAQRVHRDDAPGIAAQIALATASRSLFQHDFRVVRPDGTTAWITGTGRFEFDGDGQPTRMRGLVRDITQQRQADEARLKGQRLEAENRQIQEANRLKSVFLANMSHELRTPLNAVIGFADLLHSGFVKPESPQHQEFLGHIGTSGRHLLQLINDVLDLSKVESGKFDFFPELIDLPSVLKEAKDVLHTAIQRKHIVVTVEVDPEVTSLQLDPSRLKQVLYNYLSNAIKFTAPGGKVTVRAFVQGPDHFRLEVEDTGIGIAAADLPRLFTEFQQLDAGYSKLHQGTGLGLALTRRLVEAQGGSVGVRSTLGMGSVFHIVLNRVHGVGAFLAQSTNGGAADTDRVLVIERDPGEQRRLAAAFSQAGFEVDATDDSAKALSQARDVQYAAMTLDLSLPSQRGLDLLADIRSHGASHATPVIGVTMPADERSATFSIANLLCKPIRSDEILLAMAPFKSASGRAKVLVIDDDGNALDLMRATLDSIGVQAVCVQDGRDALRDIEQTRPDAIILDLMMPEFDGFQVLDALQRLPDWRHVPVFIWTSLLLTDEEYATLARSARAVLMKGGGAMEDLLERVRRLRPAVVSETDGAAR